MPFAAELKLFPPSVERKRFPDPWYSPNTRFGLTGSTCVQPPSPPSTWPQALEAVFLRFVPLSCAPPKKTSGFVGWLESPA